MNKLQFSLAMLATAGTLSLSTIAPASADSAASTRNILLGAAALAGLAIESNVSRKNARANNISGYLPDGSAVYGDGRVVARNGDSYYPGNNGQTVSCSNGQCSIAYANDRQYGNGAYASGRRNDANGAYANDRYSGQNNGRYNGRGNDRRSDPNWANRDDRQGDNH